MREFQHKRQYKKFLYSKFTVFCLIIITLFSARAVWKVYTKEQESAANVVRAEGQLKRLKDRQELLESEIERLKTSEGQEEEIRSKYNVSRPGEQLLIIVNDDTPTTTPEKSESWWDKFIGIFK